jgi:peptidoglycan/LPS O-acetylase OafA/YrhL
LVIVYHAGLGVPGARGVMMFFVLSGFLITWLLLDELEKTGTISIKDFYRRRTLRIFPAFYAFWLGTVAFRLMLGVGVPWEHAWSSFFYVSNYYSALSQYSDSVFSHTWSLAVEEQFYLLWPLVFFGYRHNLRLLARVLTVLIVCVVVHRAVLVYAFDVEHRYLYYAFDTRIDQLLSGCLLAIMLRRRDMPRFWEAVCSHQAAPLITILAVSVLSVGGRAFMPRYRDVIGFTIEPVLAAIFLAQVIALSETRAWSWLDAAPIRYLGKISYPLYLFQPLTLWPVQDLLREYSAAVQFAAAVSATIAVASLSYYVIERPFIQLGRRRTAVSALVAPAAAV